MTKKVHTHDILKNIGIHTRTHIIANTKLLAEKKNGSVNQARTNYDMHKVLFALIYMHKLLERCCE